MAVTSGQTHHHQQFPGNMEQCKGDVGTRGFTPRGSRAGPHSGPIPLTRSRALGAAPWVRERQEAHLQDWTRGVQGRAGTASWCSPAPCCSGEQCHHRYGVETKMSPQKYISPPRQAGQALSSAQKPGALLPAGHCSGVLSLLVPVCWAGRDRHKQGMRTSG